MKRDEALVIAGKVALNRPVPAWDESTIDSWAEQLADLDAELTADIVIELLRTEDVITVPKIRIAVALRNCEAAGVPILTAIDAWRYVQGVALRRGTSIAFPADNPVVKRVVEGVGWVAICRSQAPDVVRGQFLKQYEAERDRVLKQVAARDGARPQLRRKPEVRQLTEHEIVSDPPALPEPKRAGVLEMLRGVRDRVAARIASPAAAVLEVGPIEYATVEDPNVVAVREARKRELEQQAAALRGGGDVARR